jgi:hypothetical protein
MDHKQAQSILDKVIGQITGYKNPFSMEQFLQKYTYNVTLPVEVHDATTGEATWTQSINASKFMTLKNINKQAQVDDWALPKRPVTSVEDILKAWNEVNYITTERQIDSLNIAQSDNIYFSENVFRSQDITRCKNIVYCESINNCEYVVASQRSGDSSYCARLEDSTKCSGSFGVVWSGNVVNSLFIQDSSNIYECMFCSKLKDKKFCIANMQFKETEYYQLKDMVLRWLLGADRHV